jgi:hypothetical protein
MPDPRIQVSLVNPVPRPIAPYTWVWCISTVAIATIYSLMAFQKAFSGNYIVEEDERVFVSFLQQFLDPELLPNDWGAAYFRAVTPMGYQALFGLMAQIGIEPILFSKLILLFIPLVGSAYLYFVCLEILPVPIAAFMAVVMFNQNVWMNSLFSSTPRGFIYALFPAFIYYVLRRSLLPCLLVILLQGLLYPPYLFIFAGILVLRCVQWQGGKPSLSQDKHELWWCGLGVGLAIVVMVPYALSSSEFGPVVTLAQAKVMPEFQAKGRVPFFTTNPEQFYLWGWHSGLFAAGLLKPPKLVLAAFLLPVLLRLPDRFPLAQRVQPAIAVLPQILVASFGMFMVAHVLLLRFYLPNRYTIHTLRIVLVIAAAIALMILIDAVLRWSRSGSRAIWKRVLALGFAFGIGGAVLLLPVYLNARAFGFPRTPYLQAREVSLYEFLRQQPKDSLTASLSSEADNLPTFAQRPILVGFEYANPYHLRYHDEIKRRVFDLARAQYSPDLDLLQRFVRQYGVDYWLVDAKAFQPIYFQRNHWFMQWQDLAREVNQGQQPALVRLQGQCEVLKTEGGRSLLAADCILRGG